MTDVIASAGGSGGSSPLDGSAGGSGGSSPLDGSAGGLGGSSPLASTVEETLCRIFADVLGLDLVRPDEEFFDVGGDSVLALKVVARAREAGLALSVRDLFDRQSPGALAAVTGDPAGRSPLGADTDTARDPGGSSPRNDTAPLLTFSADELADFEDTDIGQQVGGTSAGWAEGEWETVT